MVEPCLILTVDSLIGYVEFVESELNDKTSHLECEEFGYFKSCRIFCDNLNYFEKL
jgi:hypothetical protein